MVRHSSHNCIGSRIAFSSPGKDATEAFEDVGHSDEARELLAGMLVGEFEKGSVSFAMFFLLVERTSAKCFQSLVSPGENSRQRHQDQRQACTSFTGFKVRRRHPIRLQCANSRHSVSYFIPLAALAAYFAWRFYYA